MNLHTLALGVVACALAVFAQRLAAEVNEPAPPAAVATVRDARVLTEVTRMLRPLRIDPPKQIIEPRVEVADDFGKVHTISEQRADQLAELEVALDDKHGVLHGQVRDYKSNEILAGVTILVRSDAGNVTQAAITDENGYYEFPRLPRGAYLVMFYYVADSETTTATVIGGQLTPFFHTMVTRPDPGITIEREDVRTEVTIDESNGSGGSLSGTTGLEGRYEIDSIETEGLELGDPEVDETGDGIGVSFVGRTTIENHYVIDGE
jgi:hypothetical protein